MGFKTITVKDEAYDAIAGLKHVGESFTRLFLRLPKETRGGDIMRLAGAWKMTPNEYTRLRARMKKLREESNADFEKRMKRLA